MIGKLAIRNIKKSMSDYAVYFVTLIIGISVFYVFNSISDQKIMKIIFASQYDVIELIENTLSATSVVVSFVLAFLIVYASNFLMKRRRKEFGVYMLLGMGKRKLAAILITETIIIGLFSLIVGLLTGVVLSQGMSVLVASAFEADMSQFTFEISGAAMGKTLLYFLAMYVLVLVLDIAVTGKSKLITLLNAGRSSEKSKKVHPLLCFIVFVVAVIVLGSAYYTMTVRVDSVTEGSQVMMEIVKGIITTFLIFWSLSGLFIFFSKLRKKHYLKGLNVFTVNEIGKRFNTNVLAGGIICLMLFMTICILTTSLSINKSVNDNLENFVPVDINIVSVGDEGNKKEAKPVSSVLAEKGIDTQMFQDAVEISVYAIKDNGLTAMDTLGKQFLEAMAPEDEGYAKTVEFLKTTPEDLLKVSEYNRVAQLYGKEQYSLEEDEYMVIADYQYMKEMRDTGLEDGVVITIGDREYHPRYPECKDGFLEMSGNASNDGIILIPDSVSTDNFLASHRIYMANYNKEYAGGVEKLEKYFDSEKFEKKMGKQIEIVTRKTIYDRSIGLMALVVFMGLYLGIVFIIASAAILSLKELSQAADSREKYQVLRRLGVDERMIHSSLFRQNATFFGVPLIIATIHSIFGIQVCLYVAEAFGKTGLFHAILTTAIILLVIYLVYFVVTYRCARKIIDE